MVELVIEVTTGRIMVLVVVVVTGVTVLPNVPSFIPFTRTAYWPAAKVPSGMVTENGFKTVMQA